VPTVFVCFTNLKVQILLLWNSSLYYNMTRKVTALLLLWRYSYFLIYQSVLKYSEPIRLRKWALVLSSIHHVGLFLKREWIERNVIRYSWGAHISQKCRSHVKLLGARMVTWSKFHTKDPQILGAAIQNSVAMATWRPGFVHPCAALGWNMFCFRGGMIHVTSNVVFVERRRNLESPERKVKEHARTAKIRMKWIR
jgi:hypothetical protein